MTKWVKEARQAKILKDIDDAYNGWANQGIAQRKVIWSAYRSIATEFHAEFNFTACEKVEK